MSPSSVLEVLVRFPLLYPSSKLGRRSRLVPSTRARSDSFATCECERLSLFQSADKQSVTILWFIIAIPLLCFPAAVPVTPDTMNCTYLLAYFTHMLISRCRRGVRRLRSHCLHLVSSLGTYSLPWTPRQSNWVVINNSTLHIGASMQQGSTLCMAL